LVPQCRTPGIPAARGRAIEAGAEAIENRVQVD